MTVRFFIFWLTLQCCVSKGQSLTNSFLVISYSGDIDKKTSQDFEKEVIAPAHSANQLYHLAEQWRKKNRQRQFRASILGPQNSNFVYIQNYHLGVSLRAMTVTRGVTLQSREDLSCVFSDTLLVPDSLLIVPQGARQSDQFKLRTNVSTFMIPRNPARELILSTSQFPELMRGRYTSVSIDWLINGQVEATWSCKVYLLSDSEQKALSNMIATCYDVSQISCTKAINELNQYLRGIIGDKHCTQTITYENALRNSLRRFVRNNTSLCRED